MQAFPATGGASERVGERGRAKPDLAAPIEVTPCLRFEHGEKLEHSSISERSVK